MNKPHLPDPRNLVDAIDFAVALFDGETLTIAWMNATMAGWTGLRVGDSILQLGSTLREEGVRSRMLRNAAIRFESLHLQQHHHRAVGWTLRQLPGRHDWLLEGRDDTRLRRERAIAQAYVEEQLHRSGAAPIADATAALAFDVIEGPLQDRIYELSRADRPCVVVAVRWADDAGRGSLLAALATVDVDVFGAGRHAMTGLVSLPTADGATVLAWVNRLSTALTSESLRPFGVAAAICWAGGGPGQKKPAASSLAAELLELLAGSPLGHVALSPTLAKHCGHEAVTNAAPGRGIVWSSAFGGARAEEEASRP